MTEHIVIALSKVLEKKHKIEDEIDELKEAQIRQAVEKCGVPYETYLAAKEEIKRANKDKDFVAALSELKDKNEEAQEEFESKVAESTDYMVRGKDSYSLKLADCTITYKPKPKYHVIDMDPVQKEKAIKTIIENEWWSALEINSDAYIVLNEVLKLQNPQSFKNCPGIIDRDFFYKEEFSVRKSSKKSK